MRRAIAVLTNLGLACLVLALLALGNPAHAKRVALVIGNSAYEYAPALKNPRNDAQAMSAVLTKLGFEVVTGIDLTHGDFARTVGQFRKKLKGADVGLFFYAGHGLQVYGQNYLAPVDAKLEYEDSLEFEAVTLKAVLRLMEREARTNIVFLDSCRDNPLARNLARGMGTRSAAIGRGLARVETGIGTMISFATQPGNVALDGEGKNSPFTAALLNHIETPGLDIANLMRAVRLEVLTRTQRQQVPWSNSSLTGPFIFNDKPKEEAKPVAAPAIDTLAIELAYWQAAKDAATPQGYEVYLRKYPNGNFAPLVAIKLAELAKIQAREAREAKQKAELEAAKKKQAEADKARREAEAKQRAAREAVARKQAAAEAAKRKEEADRRQRALAELENKQAEAEAAKRKAEADRRQRELAELENKQAAERERLAREREELARRVKTFEELAQTQAREAKQRAELEAAKQKQAEADKAKREAEARQRAAREAVARKQAEAEAAKRKAEADRRQRDLAELEKKQTEAEAAKRNAEADRRQRELAELEKKQAEERERLAKQREELARRLKTFEEQLKARAEAVKQKEQKLAALQPPELQPKPDATATLLLDPYIMTLVLQNELKRVGCKPGKVDGKWSKQGSTALARFNIYARLKLPTDAPTMDALEAVKGSKERVCPLICGPQFNKTGDQCVKKRCGSGTRLNKRGLCVKVAIKTPGNTPRPKTKSKFPYKEECYPGTYGSSFADNFKCPY